MTALLKRTAPLMIILLLLPGLVWGYSPGLAAAEPPQPTPQNLDPPLEDAPPDKEGAQAFDPSLPQAPPTLPITDQFGYTLDDGTYSWLDATAGGAEISFDPCTDDCWVQVPLPFSFAFYEHTYSQVYVTTNGVLIFGGQEPSYNTYDNSPIPLETLPNGYVAPLWDDLDLSKDGHVFQKNNEGLNLVIEWSNVIRHGALLTQTLTFETVLYPDGNILFQYQTLNGDTQQCTVGIEDPDGVDGLQYLYNSLGLNNGLALSFTRPAPAKRGKVLPTYLGQLTQNGKTDFSLEVVNIGEQGQDRYDLTYVSSSPGWSVSFLNGSTGLPLSDSNGNGQPDTGWIGQMVSFPVKARVQAPPSSAVGAFTKITVTAKSSGGDEATSILDSSIPAPFGYALSYGLTGQNQGIHFGGVSYFSHLRTVITSFFGGSTIAVRRAPEGTYLYVWTQGVPNTDIRYMLLDRYGRQASLSRQLTDNSGVAQKTDDRSPVLASTADNRFGVAWIHSVYSNTISSTNYNIYFKRLSPDGYPIVGNPDITKNTLWVGKDTSDNPEFRTPCVEATNDYRFLLGWVEHKVVGNISQDDVWIAAYDSNGSLVKSPTKITNSASTGKSYLNPALASLGNKVFLLYTEYTSTGSYAFKYQVLRSDGTIDKSENPFTGSSNTGAGVVQLSDGNLLIAWVELSTGQVKYSVLNGSDFNPLVTGGLPIPNRRSPSDVSVTRDQSGRGIVVWMDSRSNFLYYALVNSGGVLTNAMAFHSELESTLYFSATHRGAAPYEGFAQVFLPLIRK